MASVRQFVGKPFRSRGRNIDKGLDCWGLAMAVFKEYDITLPDFIVDAFAFHTIDVFAGKEVGSRLWEEVYDPSDKDVPLVVLMRMHSRLVTHAGVYIGNGRIIHTMEKTGVVVSRVKTLESRIVGYYRLCSK